MVPVPSLIRPLPFRFCKITTFLTQEHFSHSSTTEKLNKPQENNNSLPINLQAQLDGAQVIDIYCHDLGQCCKQVLGFTRDVPHHHMTGQALQLCYLGGEGRVEAQ